MSNVLLLLYGWIAMAIIMALLWCVQARTDNPSIVDPMWAIGLLLLTFCYAWVGVGLPARQWLVAAMVSIWSLRLSWHLIKRIKTLSEDGRYTDMRNRWGAKAPLYFFMFFQIQAFWSVMFSVAPLVAMCNPKPLNLWDIIGIVIWLAALIGEAIADKQLSAFRANPANRGQVCNTGLWRYSRHPNYFFEWLHWWAYVVMAAYWPYGVISLVGPVIMLYFLLKVTGVPPTEAQSLRTRGEAYRVYQQTTNKFFPWFPKH